LKGETLDREFEKDIEEAQTLRDIERLEKKDSQLWLLTILITLILTLFTLIRDFDTLNLSPGEFLQNLASLKFSALVLPVAILILGFCAYVLFRNRKIRYLRREITIQKVKMERIAGTLEEGSALFRISSSILQRKELKAILEMITRESLNCLNAQRSTLFLAEERSGVLKAQYTFSSDPIHEQVSLFEEKEVARKTLRQKKTLLLREPEDFSDFFKYEGRDHKITSLMSVGLLFQGKGGGVLSVVRIGEERKFTEKDLKLFMIFANLASLAMDVSYLSEQVRKGIGFRKNYEQYLDNILNQLQNLSEVERKRIEDHIEKLLPIPSPQPQIPLEDQAEEVVKGTMPLTEQAALERPGADLPAKILQVDYGSEAFPMPHDLGDGGVFIRTPNPLDLGEQFLLKLHLVEGEEPIEVPCKVVWTNKYGKESRHLRRGMGVKFLNLSPERQSRVEEYIRSHKNKEFFFAEDPQHLSMKE